MGSCNLCNKVPWRAVRLLEEVGRNLQAKQGMVFDKCVHFLGVNAGPTGGVGWCQVDPMVACVLYMAWVGSLLEETLPQTPARHPAKPLRPGKVSGHHPTPRPDSSPCGSWTEHSVTTKRSLPRPCPRLGETQPGMGRKNSARLPAQTRVAPHARPGLQLPGAHRAPGFPAGKAPPPQKGWSLVGSCCWVG